MFFLGENLYINTHIYQIWHRNDYIKMCDGQDRQTDLLVLEFLSQLKSILLPESACQRDISELSLVWVR